ncbi:MAG: hypothetical protein ACK4UV_05550 [Ignavibacterium sp.]
MSQYTPNFFWTFNCSPGPNDYDYNANWENISVQRNNLQYVKVTLHHWNEIDGWKTISRIYVAPNAPTFDPFNFNAHLVLDSVKVLLATIKCTLERDINLILCLR